MLTDLPRNARIGLALITVCIAALSQNPPSVKQEAKNTSCSNIVALAGNATVTCSSLTLQQRKIIEGIPSVLNKILTNQLDPTAVMAKLDEIKKGIDDIKKKQGPWIWTKEIQSQTQALLGSLPIPEGKVVLASQSRSSQAIHQGLLDSFIALKWPVWPSWTSMSTSPSIVGVRCSGPGASRTTLDQLQKVFDSIGVDVECLSVIGPDITIVIGERP